MIPLGVLGSAHVPASGGGALSVAYGGWGQDVANSSTYTVTGLAIGAAHATRHVVAVIAYRSSNVAPALTGVTIAGVAATVDLALLTVDNSARSILAIARAAVPDGTTATVVATFNATGLRAHIATYALTGGTPAVAGTATNDAMGSPQTLTLTPATGPAVIAAMVNGSNFAPSLTNVTTDVTVNSSESNFYFVSGHANDNPATVVTSGTTTSPPRVAIAYEAA